ncbi:hypothetical protein A8X90_001603 [Salmonella enterica subsp. enterica serovar Typhi]|nr:hypothetical protein [Salmonella enterica]EDX4981856.1 hypothetical protein [Salmonella enterica subsp. enterica serovar Typhi]
MSHCSCHDKPQHSLLPAAYRILSITRHTPLEWNFRVAVDFPAHWGQFVEVSLPRVGKLFLNWVTEDVIKQVIVNLYEFEKEMLGGKPIYLHMGHLIDKGGYLRFKERVLRGVQLNPEAMVAERIYWAEDESVARMHLKPAGH